MRLWIFNHHAQGPDLPGGTRHYDLARALVALGHDVTIFAAGFHYTLLRETVAYDGDGYKVETREGVRFVWVKTFPYTANNWRRLINIASFAWHLNFLIPKLGLQRPDIIIGSVVHPFAPLLAARFARRFRVPFIYEIRDLWPQTFIDMGVWSETGLKSRVFKRLETMSVAAAALIITLSPKTEPYLRRHYGKQPTLYLPNGVDVDAFERHFEHYHAVTDAPTVARLEQLKAQGKFVVLFTGAVVQSNRIDLFLECAKRLKNPRIHLVIVGKGMERPRYEHAAVKMDNIEFLDPVPKYLVPVMLRQADALMLVQARVQWGSTNKLFDYMASGVPLLTVLYAEHNNVVSEADCGMAADPDSIIDVVEKLETLGAMPEARLRTLGQNAIEYVRNNSAISLLAKRLETALLALTGRKETDDLF